MVVAVDRWPTRTCYGCKAFVRGDNQWINSIIRWWLVTFDVRDLRTFRGAFGWRAYARANHEYAVDLPDQIKLPFCSWFCLLDMVDSGKLPDNPIDVTLCGGVFWNRYRTPPQRVFVRLNGMWQFVPYCVAEPHADGAECIECAAYRQRMARDFVINFHRIGNPS